MILEGEAAVDVRGERYLLPQFDCTYVSAGIEHRFVNADLASVWSSKTRFNAS